MVPYRLKIAFGQCACRPGCDFSVTHGITEFDLRCPAIRPLDFPKTGNFFRVFFTLRRMGANSVILSDRVNIELTMPRHIFLCAFNALVKPSILHLFVSVEKRNLFAGEALKTLLFCHTTLHIAPENGRMNGISSSMSSSVAPALAFLIVAPAP